MNSNNRIFSFLFPSMANIVFLFIFLFLSFNGQFLLNDGDTGYHLRAGEYISEHLTVPRHDIFSYHTPPLPWIAHEWLSELIMGWIHKYFGMTAVIMFFSFLIASTCYLLFRILKKNDVNVIFSFLIVNLAAVCSSIHWLARPHIFSFLLILVWYFILDEYQYRDRNWKLLLTLPPVMSIWVNLHGGFIIGLFLIGIYFFGNLIQFFTSHGDQKTLHGDKARKFSIIFSLCLLAALMNPQGFKILLFPFSLISDKILMDNVIEFLSPDFHRPSAIIFEGYLLLSLLVFFLSYRKLNMIEILLVLFFTHMSFYSARSIAIFSLIMAPILGRHAETIVQSRKARLLEVLRRKGERYSRIDSLARGNIWLVFGVAIAIGATSMGMKEFKFSPEKHPVEAVEFLKEEIIKGNMFNSDEFGDYIIYSAFPLYKVFIDGRLDMYGSEKVKEYKEVREVKPKWDDILERYKIKWIIFKTDSHLSRHLMTTETWKIIYSDKLTSIFVKNIPQNGYLIDKYNNVNLIAK